MRKILTSLFICLAVLAVFHTAAGQQATHANQKDGAQNSGPRCPVIKIYGPTGEVDAGTPVVFNVEVSAGNKPVEPNVKWSVSAGTITSGEGTSSITVDTTGLIGQTFTVVAEIEGAGPQCDRIASYSANVTGCILPAFRIFDRYNDISFEDEKARLDNFALQLKEEPHSVGVIFYGSPVGQSNAARNRAERAKTYLVERHNIEESLISVVGSQTQFGESFREITIELHIGPKDETFQIVP
jgi:hypothetical protein